LKDYIPEHRLRQQSNIVTSPPRRTSLKRWEYNETTLKIAHNTMIIYLRRTDEHGYISFLENEFFSESTLAESTGTSRGRYRQRDHPILRVTTRRLEKTSTAKNNKT
jgi:hypothetical protein